MDFEFIHLFKSFCLVVEWPRGGLATTDCIFTHSALWAGSVIESGYPLVCVSVNYGQMFRGFDFFHKIGWLGMVLRIINLEGHKNA